jgi:uncharacterized cofD-like protein
MNVSQAKIVTIGGGTGNFTTLSAIKQISSNITAIVNMSDDGGSTGTLRDELGVLPPGDVRQCLVALSESPELRGVFNFRFGQGRFEGQSLGNIILSGLELKYGSFEEAIRVASSILRVDGQVVPVTLDNHVLVMHDGEQVIRGENVIGNHKIENHQSVRIDFDPPATLNPEVAWVIREADLIVVTPGNLYNSLLPALAVDGMSDALKETNARIVMVSNLVNKPGQTDGWHVVDYVKSIESYIGEGIVDEVLYNTALPPDGLLHTYASEGELPLDITPERFGEIKARAIGVPLVDERPFVPEANDTLLRRTLIRHDVERLKGELRELL